MIRGKHQQQPKPPRAIDWRRLDEVVRAPRNPRKHDGKRIKSSVDAHGFLEPLIEDSRTGKLVSGHGRLDDLLARCEAGQAPPEGLRQDADGMYLVPVITGWRSRSDADADHALVAVNQRGEWDPLGVNELLGDILDAGLALDGTEFDDIDIDELLRDEPAVDSVGDNPDQTAGFEVRELTDERAAELDESIPEPPRDPTTKKGERVTLGPHTLYCDDCIAIMRAQPDQSIDAIVTDPPYGIDFMGKGWDNAVPGPAWAEQCFRVLKPGAHLIAFAATRTLHQLTTVLEQTGFEVRDVIGWLRWSGYPASRYALKPSLEPAVLVRKPLPKGASVAASLAETGLGGLLIENARYRLNDPAWPRPQGDDKRRWPANIYACPSASDNERNRDCDELPLQSAGGLSGSRDGSLGNSPPKMARNHHNTVKPVKLMSWLLRLVTPPGGVVFEPFGGSGTTLVAAVASGLDATLIATELEPAYCDIIRARVEGALRG